MNKVTKRQDKGNPGPIVDVEGLSIALNAGGQPLISDISFTVSRGECVGLVGESGSGKSLTSRALLGLNDSVLKQSAKRLRLFGRDYSAASETEWRRLRGIDVGYVLQDALGAFDPLRSVFSEIRETLDAHGVGTRAERGAAVLETLERVGFPDPALRSRQQSHQLSGGLRQRALIASAIVAAPGLVIADEPTTALDVNIQARIIALLAKLKQDGIGLLFVSHDLAVVSSIADRVLVMNAGRVVESGTTTEVLDNPQHEYTRMLIRAMPSNVPRGGRLSQVEMPPSSVLASMYRTETSQAGDAPALSVERLDKSYTYPDESRVKVVSNVSFELRKGEILGLVGGSGSGKSTVAKIAMGLTEADDGKVRLFGKPWSGLKERERTGLRRHIQMISQDPLAAFDPRYTVRQLLFEALEIANVPKAGREAQARQALVAVGLAPELLDRLPRKMSGGQRQRVAIARALATRPDVLICDEPVSALDVSVQAQILDLLSHIHQEIGLSVLFISHDLSVVRHFCERVLVMHKGEIVEQGEVETIFASASHPYTRDLLTSIPVMHKRYDQGEVLGHGRL